MGAESQNVVCKYRVRLRRYDGQAGQVLLSGISYDTEK